VSDKVRMPLAQAQAVAEELVGLLGLWCERLEVAGSIRRGKAEVGDIELLAVPRQATALDLFGGAGATTERISYDGVAVDLFAVLPPAEFGLLMAIRTGPADWSHRLVTPRRQGGWLPDHLRVHDGHIEHIRDGEVVPTPEEPEVFRVVNQPYVLPERRS
jgi:DNA polymerase/3'-5' exonuclease PolX